MNESLDHLEKYDKKVVESLEKITDKTASKGGQERAFLNAFKSFCTPLIQNIFCGYLNIESLMFVWDQYVLGTDADEYDIDIIPIICAIIFMILREQLIEAQSVSLVYIKILMGQNTKSYLNYYYIA